MHATYIKHDAAVLLKNPILQKKKEKKSGFLEEKKGQKEYSLSLILLVLPFGISCACSYCTVLCKDWTLWSITINWSKLQVILYEKHQSQVISLSPIFHASSDQNVRIQMVFLPDHLWYQDELCMSADWWKGQSENSLQDCQILARITTRTWTLRLVIWLQVQMFMCCTTVYLG